MDHAPPIFPPTEKQLRAFHAVAETGGVTRAADRLGVTQPAVSAQIRSLERERGVTLFERDADGLATTEAGKALHAVTRRLFQDFADAADVLAGAFALSFGTLRLGADGPYAAMPILARFAARHPSVRIGVQMGNAADTLRALEEARVDVAVLSMREPRPGLHSLPIAEQGLRLLAPRGHLFAEPRRLPISMLDGQPVVLREPGSATRQAFEAACRQAGVRPETRLSLGSREAVREAVAAGFGVTVVFEGETGSDGRLIDRPLECEPTGWRLSIACRGDRRALPTVRAFLDLAAEPGGAVSRSAATGTSGSRPRSR